MRRVEEETGQLSQVLGQLLKVLLGRDRGGEDPNLSPPGVAGTSVEGNPQRPQHIGQGPEVLKEGLVQVKMQDLVHRHPEEDPALKVGLNVLRPRRALLIPNPLLAVLNASKDDGLWGPAHEEV
ncbi:hypothetical protein ACLWNE_05070 [Thermus oshimai]|uniref:hypothetical protein n=1 Tax=Thermus oshimai TaxID=56957 RepID=UPI0039A52AE7